MAFYVSLLFNLILIMFAQSGIITAPNKTKSNFQITQNDPYFEK